MILFNLAHNAMGTRACHPHATHTHTHTHTHTQEGMNALKYAEQSGQNAVVAVLKEHMAQGKQRM